MKKLILLALAAILASCDVVVVEPRYDERDRIIGSFRVVEYSETYNSYAEFDVWISKSGPGEDVVIRNFYDSDIDVIAEVAGGKLYIPWQMIDGFEIEGVGTIVGDDLRMNYSVKDTYYHKPKDFCEIDAWRNY